MMKKVNPAKIEFNRPFISGKELVYLQQVLRKAHISGNGIFTKKCHEYFERQFGFGKCFLTTSCTDALEMSALLADIQPGDEVIIPSYTFVSSANPFILRGARIVFADSENDNPNVAISEINKLISPKTKAVVVVHYAGIACDMDILLSKTSKSGIAVIEDAAHGFDSYYKKKPLGSIGNFGALSFHSTKNISCGEGGLLIINDKHCFQRAEIIWEKGTNRAAFYRGEVDKYGWVDLGSSFLPSELTAAFLWAQVKEMKKIQRKRTWLWHKYYKGLKKLEDKKFIHLPKIPEYATVNGHLFFMICKNLQERDALIRYLKVNGIQAAFHYLPLHKSPFFKNKHDGRRLPNADNFSDCLLRLPLHYYLSDNDVGYVIKNVKEFYSRKNSLM